MPLIKHNRSSPVLNEAVVLDLGDLRGQAAAILDEARRHADAIRAAAEQEGAAIRARAAEEGHAEGSAAGRAEGHAAGLEAGRAEAMAERAPQLDALLQAWTAALRDWNEHRRLMLAEARADAVLFALAVAEKITHRVIDCDPAVVQDQLAEALHLLTRPSACVVTVHPEDRALVETVAPELARQLAEGAEIRFAEDAGQTRGGCRVAVAGGEIDARIETQIARIVDALIPPAPPAPSAAPMASDDPSDPEGPA